MVEEPMQAVPKPIERASKGLSFTSQLGDNLVQCVVGAFDHRSFSKGVLIALDQRQCLSDVSWESRL